MCWWSVTQAGAWRLILALTGLTPSPAPELTFQNWKAVTTTSLRAVGVVTAVVT